MGVIMDNITALQKSINELEVIVDRLTKENEELHKDINKVCKLNYDLQAELSRVKGITVEEIEKIFSPYMIVEKQSDGIRGGIWLN